MITAAANALPSTLTDAFLTPDQVALRDRARRFALEEVLPLANELDPQKAAIPPALLEKMGAAGWFGVMVDAEHGGLGGGVLEYCLVAEELARAWMSVASIIARAQGMGTQFGPPENRAALLRRSASGKWIGAAALSEPNAGSDLAAVSCRASRDGDDWVLTGEKRWCGNALAADFIQVLARVSAPGPGEPRAAGLANFVVTKERNSFPDGMKGQPIDKIGYHGMITWNLQLDGVRVPAGNRLGSGDATGAPTRTTATEAFRQTQRGLNTARVHTAARACGLARGALEDALGYAAERVQFGRAIGEFQALRFMLADMAAELESARVMTHQVARAVDIGMACESESAMVKLLATEMAERVTSKALQVHGGNGYTTERAVERYWRDARLTTIFEGTSEIQRRIISDRLFPKKTTNSGATS